MIQNMFRSKGWQPNQILNLENQTAQQIQDEIQTLRVSNEPHKVSCLAIFVLSHGELHFIFGSDGVKVDIREDILKPLDESHCRKFGGVPKLFFFQACQDEVVPIEGRLGAMDYAI